MLINSKDGIMATGKFGNDLKRDTSNEELGKKTLNRERSQYFKICKWWICTIQRWSWRIHTANEVRSMKQRNGMDIQYQSYRQIFNHICESKSCRLSGLHMSHWKAAVEGDCLTELHANMTWMAFTMGVVNRFCGILCYKNCGNQIFTSLELFSYSKVISMHSLNLY